MAPCQEEENAPLLPKVESLPDGTKEVRDEVDDLDHAKAAHSARKEVLATGVGAVDCLERLLLLQRNYEGRRWVETFAASWDCWLYTSDICEGCACCELPLCCD